jgi:hypothetical protein
MLKFLSSVMAAAAIAGALTFLSGPTSARLDASPLTKPEEAALKPAPSGLGPVSIGLVPHRSELREFRLLTNDDPTPGAGMLRGAVSDARILLENSQIQDW